MPQIKDQVAAFLSLAELQLKNCSFQSIALQSAWINLDNIYPIEGRGKLWLAFTNLETYKATHLLINFDRKPVVEGGPLLSVGFRADFDLAKEQPLSGFHANELLHLTRLQIGFLPEEREYYAERLIWLKFTFNQDIDLYIEHGDAMGTFEIIWKNEAQINQRIQDWETDALEISF